jgi:hypothetical protein
MAQILKTVKIRSKTHPTGASLQNGQNVELNAFLANVYFLFIVLPDFCNRVEPFEIACHTHRLILRSCV